MDRLTALVVADGHAAARDLARALRRNRSISILGPAFDERAALEVLAGGVVDVVVIDLDRKDRLGLDLVGSLRAAAPVPVVATGMSVDAADVARVLAAGGSGLLPRDGEPEPTARLLRAAAVGEIALPDADLAAVVDHLHQVRDERRRGAFADLTPREREVLALLCEGLSTGDIAARLGVSVSTIQAHTRSVFTKLGVHSQVEAVRAAWRNGIAVPISA